MKSNKNIVHIAQKKGRKKNKTNSYACFLVRIDQTKNEEEMIAFFPRRIHSCYCHTKTKKYCAYAYVADICCFMFITSVCLCTFLLLLLHLHLSFCCCRFFLTQRRVCIYHYFTVSIMVVCLLFLLLILLLLSHYPSDSLTILSAPSFNCLYDRVP